MNMYRIKCSLTGHDCIPSDTDECKYDLDNCHADAVCTNTNGSFNCACLTGYSGNGISCQGKVPSLLPRYVMNHGSHSILFRLQLN